MACSDASVLLAFPTRSGGGRGDDCSGPAVKVLPGFDLGGGWADVQADRVV
jgi:hypothetical protein